ncbi:hypothetical protein [Natranaeroarchaeum aerophilus]|uniref:Competence protein CoiA n=1 Tax=Natranaeroarchaeum aerophilus TaxID=2917711 RepID=A0AAE3FP76_9EURY|nr:hypothetical protein [Natranaeroarchaeum aerophilus]MCL9812611.1 hypothetical protein [Natranaeroarchaeum aerophilus]
MPFLGTLEGDRVIPPQVEDNATVVCPVCDEQMTVISSYERENSFVSRHFRHEKQEADVEASTTTGQATLDEIGKTGKCPGESDQHLKMKSIAYARLDNDFSEATLELESGIGDRVADVLLTFDEPRNPYGRGIAVEVQYRNEGKDIEAVTDHYLASGYSVVWLDEDDFSDYDVDLSGILTVWPYALPDRSALEGYPDIVRWLRQEKSPTVEREIPLPGEFWISFDKSDEWVRIAKQVLRRRGRAWATISRSPWGDLTFQLGKRESGYNADIESVTVQVSPEDCDRLRAFADRLEREGFESEPPSPPEREEAWHDIFTEWLSGTDTITAWLSATFSPDDDIVIALGKKHPKETDRVSMVVDRRAVNGLSEIADLLERAFEIERKK